MRRVPGFALMAVLAAMAAGNRVAAATVVDAGRREQLAAAATVMADNSERDRIVEAMQRKYHAQVVKVAEIVVDGRRVYSLRLLSDNRVWMVRVDAETGQELPGS